MKLREDNTESSVDDIKKMSIIEKMAQQYISPHSSLEEYIDQCREEEES